MGVVKVLRLRLLWDLKVVIVGEYQYEKRAKLDI